MISREDLLESRARRRQKRLLFCRALASQRDIAMGEATVAADYVAVAIRMLQSQITQRKTQGFK